MTKEEMEIYKDAVEEWGTTAQLDQTIEECAELITAINKWKRRRITPEELMDEVVDVGIMIEQMRIILNDEVAWKRIKEFKLDRVRKRLDATKHEENPHRCSPYF
jgi:NTP pyrophosphatase (non-canonical NTP hydrolase)